MCYIDVYFHGYKKISKTKKIKLQPNMEKQES